ATFRYSVVMSNVRLVKDYKKAIEQGKIRSVPLADFEQNLLKPVANHLGELDVRIKKRKKELFNNYAKAAMVKFFIDPFTQPVMEAIRWCKETDDASHITYGILIASWLHYIPFLFTNFFRWRHSENDDDSYYDEGLWPIGSMKRTSLSNKFLRNNEPLLKKLKEQKAEITSYQEIYDKLREIHEDLEYEQNTGVSKIEKRIKKEYTEYLKDYESQKMHDKHLDYIKNTCEALMNPEEHLYPEKELEFYRIAFAMLIVDKLEELEGLKLKKKEVKEIKSWATTFNSDVGGEDLETGLNAFESEFNIE
ncbi:MAG: hypothetical protein AAF182_04660, partial [Pseudomonadota bacterium]